MDLVKKGQFVREDKTIVFIHLLVIYLCQVDGVHKQAIGSGRSIAAHCAKVFILQKPCMLNSTVTLCIFKVLIIRIENEK